MLPAEALTETEHDRNTIEDGRIPQLRKEAFKAIRSAGGAEHLSAVLGMLDNPRLLDAPSSPDDERETLLEFAVQQEAVDCARVLLKSGANPMHSRLSSGFTAMHVLACNAAVMTERSMRELVALLVGAGADLDAKERHSNDCWRWTPLHYAIYNGSPKFAEILIESGATVDPRLLEDAEMEAKITPDPQEDNHQPALEALRLVRALAIEQRILAAMPDEPEGSAKPSTGMTL